MKKLMFYSMTDLIIIFVNNKKKATMRPGAPGKLSQLSVQLLISAQVTISQFMRSSPALGSALTAWSLLRIVSLPSVSLPCSCTCALSLTLSLSQNK